MTELRPRPRRSLPGRLLQWWQDLMLGVRLAVSGGRAGWGRLALTAIGVGMGVAVLLAATSTGHMLQSRDDRGYARALPDDPTGKPVHRPGVDPVYALSRGDTYGERSISGYVVQKTGPNAPLPPGVTRLPDAGEIVLSPALSELLDSPDGALLRPRFAEHVIGAVGPQGLTGPHELFFYVGVDALAQQSNATEVYQFGRPSEPTKLDGLLWLLIVLGGAALLIPVAVFVATSSRLAAAARDRRLAALRLVGADRDQVLRIAAGEAFVGALVGLVVGVVLFLLGRSLVPEITVASLHGGIYADDIRPEWTLAVLIVVAVPLLAAAVAMFSLRRIIIEPLGVVRHARNQRRKLWWRLVPPALGIVSLASQGGRLGEALDGNAQNPVLAGIVLLLSSVPLLLPWIVERVVAGLGGGSPAWQLAVRRLQLDGGTPARVVGGVAVVLTGAIAVQTMFIPAESRYRPSDEPPQTVSVNVASLDVGRAMSLAPTLRGVPQTDRVTTTVTAEVQDGKGGETSVYIGGCDELRKLATIGSCRDGDVFVSPAKAGDGRFEVAGGQSISLASYAPGRPTRLASWTLPATIQPARPVTSGDGALVYATPAALAAVATAPMINVEATVYPRTNDLDYVEHVRNALLPFGWSAFAYAAMTPLSGTFLMVAQVLAIGAVITLLLAAASMLVVALEQIRERRRALAVLSANGVRRAVLARSLLWQTAVPIAVAVVVALASGLVLGSLLLYVTKQPIAFDWSGIALFAGTAIVAVLVSTGCTLPALWRAASAEGLHGE